MLQIIQPRTETKEYAYRRIFQGNYECHGFLCDDEGNPIFRNAREELLFNKCVEKPNRYKDCGRIRREATTVSPAIGLCECGSQIRLEVPFRKHALRCRCGRLYDREGKEIRR